MAAKATVVGHLLMFPLASVNDHIFFILFFALKLVDSYSKAQCKICNYCALHREQVVLGKNKARLKMKKIAVCT